MTYYTVFWYLYAYIAFLIALLFLKAIIKTITEVHYIYLRFIYGGDSVSGISFRVGQRENVW